MGKIGINKRGSRHQREREVLFGLIDLYLLDGKPIGSNTLKVSGFDHLSSATIRNYFAKLELEGYLIQHHASGGRVPTDKAFRLFAEDCQESPELSREDDEILVSILSKETKEVSLYLQEAIEALCEMTDCAVVISAPRFDQDFVIDVKLLHLDERRALCVIMTDFSLVHTETIYLPKMRHPLSVEKIQEYFQFRLKGGKRPKMTDEESKFAQSCYNEIILRHFVAYTNMEKEDLYRGGFSNLLKHSEFHDPTLLSQALALLEKKGTIQFMLDECFKADSLKFWIGEDLKGPIHEAISCSLVAVPYKLHTNVVGTIAILGPNRMNYGKIFGLLLRAAELISESLTNSMYKYKITYRQPETKAIGRGAHTDNLIGLPSQSLIIENSHD